MLYTKCDACDGNGDCWCEDGWLPEGITDRQVERIVKSSESNPQNTACNAVTESILESMIKDLEYIDGTSRAFARKIGTVAALRVADANSNRIEAIITYIKNTNQ